MPSLLTMIPAGMPWVAALIAIAACLGVLVKAWAVLRKVELDAGGSMRGDLMRRIGELEGRITYLETLLARENAEHTAAMQVLRHDLANESASLDAFILLAEANPDKVIELLPKIKEMRERRKMRLAAEKGAMAGALMAGDGAFASRKSKD